MLNTSPSASLSRFIAESFSASNMCICDSFRATSDALSSTFPCRSRSFRIMRSASSVTRGGMATEQNNELVISFYGELPNDDCFELPM